HQLGVTTHQIVRVSLADSKAADSYSTLRQMLSQRSDITGITGLSSALAGGQAVFYLEPEGTDERPGFVYLRYDPTFVETMGLSLMNGNLPRFQEDDAANLPVLIN